jgi:hypothetical protein
MSEKPNVSEHSQSESEHSTESNQVNVTEVLERLKALEATNARLLDESKKTKSKYQETLSMYETAEREKLEKEGDFQGLLEKEAERANRLANEMNDMKKKVLNSNIKNAVLKFGSDVHDVDDLLNQPKFSHILKDSINDVTLEVGEEKVKEYINEVLKAKPYMRKANKIVNTVDTKPNFQSGDGGTKSLNELSASEIEKILLSKFGK